MKEELKKVFDEITQRGLLIFNEEYNKSPPESLKNLYAVMNESEIIRFKKEYGSICDSLTKKEFLMVHNTYSLSVRNKTLDAFFKVLGDYRYSKICFQCSNKVSIWIWLHVVMPLWIRKMNRTLDKAE